MSTSMAVRCIAPLILDNTIPGTIEERGLKSWQLHISDETGDQFETASIEVYDLPFGLKRLSNCKTAKYLPFLPCNDDENSSDSINPCRDVEMNTLVI